MRAMRELRWDISINSFPDDRTFEFATIPVFICHAWEPCAACFFANFRVQPHNPP